MSLLTWLLIRMFVFVANSNNRRVMLLSPSLTFVRQVVSRDQLTDDPRAVHLDVSGHMYMLLAADEPCFQRVTTVLQEDHSVTSSYHDLEEKFED